MSTLLDPSRLNLILYLVWPAPPVTLADHMRITMLGMVLSLYSKTAREQLYLSREAYALFCSRLRLPIARTLGLGLAMLHRIRGHPLLHRLRV